MCDESTQAEGVNWTKITQKKQAGRWMSSASCCASSPVVAREMAHYIAVMVIVWNTFSWSWKLIDTPLHKGKLKGLSVWKGDQSDVRKV
jgi:hypothetical protein